MKEINKSSLLDKIAAMKAAIPDNKPQIIEPIEYPAEYKLKLVSFKILWSEATDKYDNKEAYTWAAANGLMLDLARCTTLELDNGYDKTKVQIEWQDGYTITDRLDLSLNAGDFNPYKMTIQEFLKPHNGVVYASNLQVGDRQNILSWEDDKNTEPTPEPQKDNLADTPDILKNLLGITETIEESNDRSDKAILKVSEQVEKCKAYILYLKMILPILETKAEEMINAKHKKSPIEIQGSKNYNLN